MENIRIDPRDSRVIRTRGLTLLKASHPEVRKLRRRNHEPSIHGNKVWNSSFLIMDYLIRNRPPDGARFMDLGCGWGPLGIYAAKRLKQKVLAVDADPEVFPFLDLHAAINNVDIETRRLYFEKITKRHMKGFHTLAGADICFWDELTPILFNLIRRALRSGVKRIIVADPGRSPFYNLAERCEQELPADVEVIERRTSTPRRASADLLVVRG